MNRLGVLWEKESWTCRFGCPFNVRPTAKPVLDEPPISWPMLTPFPRILHDALCGIPGHLVGSGNLVNIEIPIYLGVLTVP